MVDTNEYLDETPLIGSSDPAAGAREIM